MSKLRLGLAAILLTSAVIRPAVAAPSKWQPAGNWTVDFADEQCTAGRLFRADGRQVKLNLRPSPMTSDVKVLLEAARAQRGIEYERGQVHFGELKLGAESLAVTESATAGNAIISFRASREELAVLAVARRMAVSSPSLKAELPVTGLNEAMKVLDRCIADLLTHWGLSLQDQGRLASFPEPVENSRSWVRDDDYPVSALNRGAIGAVEARVMVSTDGRASDCRMVRSSGHKELDKATCGAVVKRARFRPALDRGGKPMASPYHFAINWLIQCC